MSIILYILAAALSILSAAVIGVILWRIISKKQFPLFTLLFLILPAGQLFTLYSIRSESWSVFWLTGVLLGLLADVLLLIYIISQEKKTAAEEELNEVQHRIVLEKNHYDAVQERRAQLEDIRLDFSNRLEAVSKLTHSGEDDTAREIVAALSDQLNRTRENPYCAIPVVNAVLAEKEKECEAAGIGLSVNLPLTYPLAVSPMHLCSIFSNILDNAIAACQKAQGVDKPVIRLSSLADGDYLFIKATNPWYEQSPKPMLIHGYGFRILSEIAKRYGGNFQSNYRDGKFTVVMSLLAVDPAAEV